MVWHNFLYSLIIMALIKEKGYKGIKCDYWIVLKYDWEKITNKTHVTLWLYQSRKAKNENLDNYVRVDWVTLDWWDYTVQQIYAKLKESQKETIEIPMIQENGELWTPIVEEREKNWFADAIDN